MRDFFLLTGILVLIAADHREVFAQQGAHNPASPEAAIREVVATYAENWNANDIVAWGELFTDDVDYVNRGGGWWKSNEENVAGHRRIHDQLEREGREMDLRLTVPSIEFLRPDIALVHVTSEWPGAGGEGGIMTMVMVEGDGRWRIRALQNTLVSSPVTGGEGGSGR